MSNLNPVRFTTTRLQPGYSIAEVDEFIARIEETLGEDAPPASPVTADDVRSVQFSTTRLKAGYDEPEVDAALDRYAAELERRQA